MFVFYVYIYIYIHRERERCVYIYIYRERERAIYRLMYLFTCLYLLAWSCVVSNAEKAQSEKRKRWTRCGCSCSAYSLRVARDVTSAAPYLSLSLSIYIYVYIEREIERERDRYIDLYIPDRTRPTPPAVRSRRSVSVRRSIRRRNPLLRNVGSEFRKRCTKKLYGAPRKSALYVEIVWLKLRISSLFARGLAVLSLGGRGPANSGLPVRSPFGRRKSTETNRCLAKGDFGSHGFLWKPLETQLCFVVQGFLKIKVLEHNVWQRGISEPVMFSDMCLWLIVVYVCA